MLELHGKKWVYYVDLTAPDPNKTTGEPRGYRVSIVVENEPGHYPTGGGDKSPWYWDEGHAGYKTRNLVLTNTLHGR